MIGKLFKLALKFELDDSITESKELEAVALFSAASMHFQKTMLDKFFEVLFDLPYDATSSPRAFLDHLCVHS